MKFTGAFMTFLMKHRLILALIKEGSLKYQVRK
jgi:hypothetical protein